MAWQKWLPEPGKQYPSNRYPFGGNITKSKLCLVDLHRFTMEPPAIGDVIAVWYLTDPNDCPECFGDMKFEKTGRINFYTKHLYWERKK